MPEAQSLEEIIAGLKEDEEETPDPGTESENFKKVRDYSKKLEKALKRQQDQINELTEYKETATRESRSAALAAGFKDAGLSEAQVALYPAEAEVSADAIKEFATKYGLTAGSSTEGTTEKQPQAAGFKPEGQEGGTPSNVVARSDWLKMVQNDPDAAQRLLNEGKVDLSDVAFESYGYEDQE